MDRIYHRYEKWEDYKCGFYENVSGVDRELQISKAVEMFNNEKLTKENMFCVVELWKYSCEHNLTNPSLNKIAYIGQAACCIYAGVSSDATREAWSLLSKDVQDRSDKLAEEAISKWMENNKTIQLCLNID